MGIFGRKEEYSREAFEEASKEAQDANKPTPGAGEFASEAVLHARLAEDQEDRDIKNKRVEKLLDTAHTEAEGLDKEYLKRTGEIGEILTDIKVKIEELESFEVTKLGKSQNDSLVSIRTELFKAIDKYESSIRGGGE